MFNPTEESGLAASALRAPSLEKREGVIIGLNFAPKVKQVFEICKRKVSTISAVGKGLRDNALCEIWAKNVGKFDLSPALL